MKNRTQIKIKFCISLCILIILLLLNIYAAVISDNDGSAFITKAEFETMKSEFNSQIQNYNNSIDSKIDGAIASYLSGIRLSKTQSIDSYIYKAGSKKNIIFVGELKTPDTRLGGHAEVCAQFLYKRDAGNCVWYGDTAPSIGWMNRRGNYWFIPGHFCIKIGYNGGSGGSWPADQLRIRELNTEVAQKNIVYQVATASTLNALYTSSSKCYDITPRITLTSMTLGGGYSQIIFKNGSSVVWDFGPGSNFYDYSDKEFGYTTTGLTWRLISGTCYRDSYPMERTYTSSVNCANITSCEENLYNTTNNSYIDYMAGKKIGDSAKIYVVHEADWNKCNSTPLLTLNNHWQYYIQYYTFPNDTPNGASTLTNDGTSDGDAASIGIPDVRVWMKKYKEVPVKDLIHNEWTVATENKVNYYSGIPLFNSVEKQVVEVKLKFTNNSTTSNGKFSVKDKSFDNVDLENCNIELFKDKELTQALTDFTINAGTVEQTKTFYIDANRDKTYWLKVCPSGDNAIKVESEEKFVSIVD